MKGLPNGAGNKIVSALRERGAAMHVSQITEATDLTAKQVAENCKRLSEAKRPRIQRVRRGWYTLAEAKAAEPAPAPVLVLAVAPPPPVRIVAPPAPPKPRPGRVSDSFSGAEIQIGNAIFKALLSGTDVRVMLRSDAARALIAKFHVMRERSISKSAPSGAALQSSPAVAAITHSNGADASTAAGG